MFDEVMDDQEAVVMEESYFYSTLRDFENLVLTHGVGRILQELNPEVSDLLITAYDV